MRIGQRRESHPIIVDESVEVLGEKLFLFFSLVSVFELECVSCELCQCGVKFL